MGGHRSCPYDAGVYFYAVQAVKFMGGYEPRPYEAEVYFYAVQVVRFMGGYKPRPYEVEIYYYVAQAVKKKGVPCHARIRPRPCRDRKLPEQWKACFYPKRVL